MEKHTEGVTSVSLIRFRGHLPKSAAENFGKFYQSRRHPLGARGGGPVASARSIASHFVGSLAFNSSSQFNTTTIVGACAAAACLIIRNRWPSGETS